MKRRVVVTGLGLVTPIGSTVQEVWNNVIANKHGIKPLAAEIKCFMKDGKEDINSCKNRTLPIHFACSVDDTDMIAAAEAMKFPNNGKWISNPRAQDPRYISFALHAAQQCMIDSGLNIDLNRNPRLSDRVGVSIGTGIGASIQEVISAYEDFTSTRGLKAVSPFFVPRLLMNEAAGHVSMEHQLRGPIMSSVAACASGAQAIIDAYKAIVLDEADAMLCGGTESSVQALSLAGFHRLKALSVGDIAEKTTRPFDKDRDGFVMGEGAGTMVIEELTHALNRGAKIYGEVVGYATTADAFHLTAPRDDAASQVRCIQLALNQALSRIEVSGKINVYMNCHATSTPLGDVLEVLACRKALDAVDVHADAPVNMYLSSTKGHIGHLLGAAGAVEAVFAILAQKKSRIPSTMNLKQVDPKIDNLLQHDGHRTLTLVRDPKEIDTDITMSNSFGFGGINTTIAFAKYE